MMYCAALLAVIKIELLLEMLVLCAHSGHLLSPQ